MQPTLQTQNYYPQEDLNPLFIFKDDYYQVLQHYDHSVLQEGIGEQNVSNWTFVDDLQYEFTSNYATIVKKYTRLSSLNPPANNELQTVIKRYPIGMKLLTNPHQSELTSDSWVDTVGYGVNFLNSTIFAPELAYDNEGLLGQVSETTYASNIDTNFSQTFAQIPDNTIAINETEFQSIRSGFYPMDNYIMLDDENTFSGNLHTQGHLYSWLLRSAHIFNQDYARPNLVMIRMPSYTLVMDRLKKKIWEQIIANGGNFGNYSNITSWEQAVSMGIFHDVCYSNNNDSENYRCNVVSNITHDMTTDWFETSGYPSNALDAWNNDYGSSIANFMKDYNRSDSNNNWDRIIYDGAYFGAPTSAKIKYPNLMVMAKLTPNASNALNGIKYANVSLKNNCISNYNQGGKYDGTDVGEALYYDFFDINTYDENGNVEGDFQDFLLDADDFPQYAPILRTGAQTAGNRCISNLTFTTLWNNVSMYSTPDFNFDTWHFTGIKYFGDYSWGTFITENEILATAENTGWCMWVKEPILTDIYEPQSPNIAGERNPPPNPMMTVPENTLISMNQIIKYSSDHSWQHRGYPFASMGSVVPTDPEFITLSSSDEVNGQSTRLGICFPFRDLEITDDIKCDSYFDGKIINKFNAEETVSSNKFFQLGIGAIDVIDDTEDFDWDVFDSAFDDDNINLIKETVADCLDHPNFDVSNGVKFDSLSAYDENSTEFNAYQGTLPLVPEFHQANNYNAMTMVYALGRSGGGTDKVVKLITEIYSVGLVQYIVFGAALDSEMYLNIKGRTNTLSDTLVNEQNQTVFKYTGQEIIDIENFNSIEQYDSQTSFIEKPCDILYHFLEKEIGLIDVVNYKSIEEARANSNNIKCSFSLNEEIKAKDLINQVCKDTNLFPLFKGTSEFSFTALKKTYNNTDVSSVIKNTEVLKYSFSRTPIESVHTILNVKYKKDYARDEFDSMTGWVDAYDLLANGDSEDRIQNGLNGYSYNYLGLDREDKVLEIEAPYIRDRQSAENLRDFMFLWNCNQHNILKLTLPLKYLYLEVGDIVSLDGLIQGLKAYGEDYTSGTNRNGQEIYPYFLISQTNKKDKTVDVTLYQLHNLTPTFSALKGSITRSRGYYNGVVESPNFLLEDIEELEIFLQGGNQYFTNNQKRVADVNDDGYIDINDWYSLDLLTLNINNLGDFNQDGVVNVIDIVALVNNIISGGDVDVSVFDVNEDGLVNVLDIVSLVSDIIED